MDGVIKDQKILERLDQIKSRVIIEQGPFCYCHVHKNDRGGPYSVYGFDLGELRGAIDKKNEEATLNNILIIPSYQQLVSCSEHYEELLSKICETGGWKHSHFDMDEEDNITEGILGDSLVWALHREYEPRVFIRREGVITIPPANIPENPKDIIISDKDVVNAFIKAYNIGNLYDTNKEWEPPQKTKG